MARSTRGRATGALVVAGALLLVAACSGDSGTPGADGATDGDGDGTTIRFTWWGSDERHAMTQQVVDDFMAENPDITVQTEPTAFDGYFEKLATQVAGGEAPDLITFGGSYVLEYGARGSLVDLDELDTFDLTPFDDAILTSATIDGTVYGAPTGGNTVGVVASPAIFEQAGVEMPDDATWTWEEFVDIANEISANTPDGVFGAEMRPYDLLGSYAAQRGIGGLYTPEGGLAVTADVLTDFWQMEVDLLEGGGMAGPELTTEVIMAGTEQTLIGQGRGGMIFAYSNQVGDFATFAGEDMVLLRLPGESQYQTQGAAILPSQYYGIYSGSANAEAAGRLLDYLVNSPEAGLVTLNDRGIPSNAEVREAIIPELDEYGQMQVAYVDEVSEGAAPAIPQPPGASEQNDLTVRMDGEVLFGQLTPAEAAEQWISTMESQLAD